MNEWNSDHLFCCEATKKAWEARKDLTHSYCEAGGFQLKISWNYQNFEL